MVGVCFWAVSIIFVIGLHYTESGDDCPQTCRCLGIYIDCASSQLESIPSTIPKWSTHLNLHNNAIKNLSNVAWKNLTKLTVLTLKKNNIAKIPKDAFHHQKQLKILDLNRNKLKDIDALTFKSLEQLTTLKLKRNQISKLRDGAFYGLAKIDKLILDYNHVEVISKGWLYGLETLKELSLSHNNVTSINDESWEFCRMLTFLDLSYNRLESIEDNTFKYLGDLQKLFIGNNNITFIKENAFIHLPRLKVLVLNNNKISWTVEDANGVFKGLYDLTKFHLAGNNIKSINKNAFLGLRNVTHLDLKNNNITSIQKNAFTEVPALKVLIINTTGLLCDCNLRWFVDWLRLKEFKIDAVCAYPEVIQGQSLFDIQAVNLTCDELPKPRLTEEPDLEIMALKGEHVRLSCKAMSSSTSTMKFMWKKDNVELINPDTTETSSSVDGKTIETSSDLNLRWVQHSNAGKYQCVVSNSYGTTYSQKSTISVLVFPTFVKVPVNITVQAGETAKLECAANGEPQPEIAWHKDGGNEFPAARERRMHVMPSDDVFFIVNTKPSDVGVYSCTAHNAAGTAVVNASVIIQEKPKFLKSMGDKEVTAGELVAMQCLATGIPQPTIRWLKDGEAIKPTERHFFTAEDQLMVIVDTVQSDSGDYECQLNNSLGSVSDHGRLLIKPKLVAGSPDTSNMMGILIITVVCCAVLTSIIWVVIIYQTRRRMVTQPPQTDLQENQDLDRLTHQHQLQLRHFPDNISDQSSCKDSGTGDSAKRSSDDLAHEEFTMIINGETAPGDVNNSHMPLLHYPRSTNHNRASTEPDLSAIQSSPQKDV